MVILYGDWCGDMFGMGLELGLPMGIFLLTGYLFPSPIPPAYPLINATPDNTAMPVKASQGKLPAMIIPRYLKL